MKSSCCGKSAYMNCVDFGECTCFDRLSEQRREFIVKVIEKSRCPPLWTTIENTRLRPQYDSETSKNICIEFF